MRCRDDQCKIDSVFEAVPIPMLLHNGHGSILSVNKAFIKAFGYTKQDLPDLSSLWDAIFPTPEQCAWEMDIWDDYTAKVLTNQDTPPVDLIVYTKSGVVKNILASICFIENAANQLALIIFQDITDQAVLQRRLQESEYRFRELFSNMNSGAAVYAPVDDGQDFIFKDFNASAERIDKVYRKHLLGKRVTEVFPGVKEMGLFDVFQRVWASGIPELHDQGLYQDNQIHSWRKNFVYRLISGELVVIYDDVSLHKQAEELLVKTAKKYQAVIETAVDGFLVIDMNGKLVEVNNAYLNYSGYYRSELLTMSLTDIVVETEEEMARHFTTVINSGRELFETWHRAKNGTIWPVEIAAAYWPEEGFFAFVRDITNRVNLINQIRYLAFYDPLTELPNRRLLIDRLQQAITTSARHLFYCALLFIDLDRFKHLNDTFGHDQGDLLLKHVAERLTTHTRESDTVARLGGDEFVVLLENLSPAIEEAAAQVLVVGNKIIDILNQPYSLDYCQHTSTPSIGVSLFTGSGYSVEMVLKEADIAMYEAKAAGGNSVAFFNTSGLITNTPLIIE